MAVMFRGQNRLFEARKHFLCAAQLSTYRHLNSMKDLANLLRYQLHQPEQSKEYYLKCLDHSPSFSKALLQMATLSLELGVDASDLSQSLAYFRACIASSDCSHTDRRRALCLVAALLSLCADLFAADNPLFELVRACFADFTSMEAHPSPLLHYEFARFSTQASSFAAAERWFQSALVVQSAHVSLSQPELAAPLCGLIVAVYSRFRSQPVSPADACVASAFLARHDKLPARPTRSQFRSWALCVCSETPHAVDENAAENRALIVLFALDYLSAHARGCSDSDASASVTLNETVFASISALPELTGVVLPEYLAFLMKDPANDARVIELFSQFFKSSLIPEAVLTGLLRDSPKLCKERPSQGMPSSVASADPAASSIENVALFGLKHSPDVVAAIPECRSANIPAPRRSESACVPYGCAMQFWRLFRLYGEFLARLQKSEESKAYFLAAEYLVSAGSGLHLCHRRSRMAPCECRAVSAAHLKRLFGGTESASCCSSPESL